MTCGPATNSAVPPTQKGEFATPNTRARSSTPSAQCRWVAGSQNESRRLNTAATSGASTAIAIS